MTIVAGVIRQRHQAENADPRINDPVRENYMECVLHRDMLLAEQLFSMKFFEKHCLVRVGTRSAPYQSRLNRRLIAGMDVESFTETLQIRNFTDNYRGKSG